MDVKQTPPAEPSIPLGFVEVTQGEFFARLALAVDDPMPCLNSPTYTTWETQRGSRRVWGWTTPGWKHPGEWAKRYAVRALEN